MQQTFKIMVLGPVGVGKTSTANHLVTGNFANDYKPTIGVDIFSYESKTVDEFGQPVSLALWDTDGDLGEAIFDHYYIRGADGAVIVGDLSRPSTIAAACSLCDLFVERMPGRPIGLVLNKSDLVAEDYLPDEVRSLGTKLINGVRTSAKTGANITNEFDRLAADALRVQCAVN